MAQQINGNVDMQAWDGWITDTNTWTYVSATTFTIPADYTAILVVGSKLKLTQTTVKYFNVVSTSFGGGNTTVTITGGADYSLANAAITTPNYSNMASPAAFPQWFNFTPGTTTGFAATPTTSGTRFSVNGRIVTYRFIISGTSNATNAQISLPISAQASATTGTFNFEGVLGLAQDNGVNKTTACRQVVDPSTPTVLSAYTDLVVGSWTGSGTKAIRGTAVYEI